MALIDRTATIVLLFAVGVQMLPLRLCAFEQIMTGQSCHGEGDNHYSAPVQVHAGLWDGHAGSSGHHDRACLCDMPKGELNRHVSVVVSIDLLPAVLVPSVSHAVPIDGPSFPPREAPPDGAAVTITLPLLN